MIHLYIICVRPNIVLKQSTSSAEDLKLLLGLVWPNVLILTLFVTNILRYFLRGDKFYANYVKSCWKCNCSINTHVFLLLGWLVGLSVLIS